MTQTLAVIRTQFDDALPAGSVTGATVQGLIDTLAATALFPSGSVIDGQNAAVTTSITSLASSTSCTELVLQADPANTANVKVGSSTPTIVLLPGQALTIVVPDVSQVHVQAVSGTQTINWLARV